MDQNTAQNTNNVQFPYPDFSNGNQNVVNATAQTPTNNPSFTPPPMDDGKIEELKKSLDTLIAQDSNVQTEENNKVVIDPVQTNIPVPTPVSPVSPVMQEEPKLDTLIAQDSNVQPEEKNKAVVDQVAPVIQEQPKEEIEIDEISSLEPPKEEPISYVQTPTPLPVFQEQASTKDVADIASSIDVPTQDSFDPLPSDLPKFRESLENIMPDFKKPKAMERDPKADNLAKPLPKAQVRKDSLIQREDENQQNTPIPVEVVDTNGELTMDKLFAEAINRNASDLHLAVGYPPVLRIDGELVDLDEKVLNPEDLETLVFSVLTDEKKELLEVNREIDFAYTFKGFSSARFRVNAYYSMKNISAAFRLIPSRVKTLEELMLPQMYHQFAKLKQGLILVTGPTGHGKSTTLAAILEEINRTRFCHIVTIEDPVEYVFEGKKALIDQREMNDDTHSWEIALRSALRQDPDVILVGEMRDYETIASAITLAETGHLVFATLHTNSASQTLDRIIDVFPENQQQQVRAQIANTLEAVVAQRLIPLEKGGRRAVSEIMLNNSAVSNLIREGKMHQVDNVIRTSSDIGMVYLEKSLVNLVREGVITVQRAQEYAVHPEEVLRLLKA